jgi:nucleoside-diphosphate-sugar epimerase
MMRICVTGANGKAGREAARHLREHGYEVLATDLLVPRADREDVLAADLTDHGQAVDVLDGMDAVVHLANIPAPGLAPAALTFNANTTMNFNVFHAAVQLGLQRVVWASSETTLGLPFDVPPRYAPVDESHFPYPTSTYALSKVVSETIAAQLAGWSGIPFVGLRFSNIFDREDYARVPSFWGDATRRRWNLWGYIDVRDAAAACRLALDAPVEGADHFIIAASDTVMDRPSADLMREVYPGVPLTRELEGHETLLAIDHARDVLGFDPRHSWRDEVPDEARK